jgi:hypothetical protein
METQAIVPLVEPGAAVVQPWRERYSKVRVTVSIAPDGSLDAHSEAIALLYFEGCAKREIARRLGMGDQRVGKTLDHPAVLARLAELRAKREKTVLERMADLAPRAMSRFERQMDTAEEGKLSFNQERQLINDTLDRTGYPKQTTTKVQHEHRSVVDFEGLEKLTEFGRTLLESGALAGIDFRGLGKQIQNEAEVIDVVSAEELPCKA